MHNIYIYITHLDNWAEIRRDLCAEKEENSSLAQSLPIYLYINNISSTHTHIYIYIYI